ncbi:acetyl-CoA carboxylase biotin carboxylase subunit family protein [Shouchella sp. JSM 1781072]|uniref:ATP-grasp domain-containing protein n=1 Tax=Bacillaceae TaxID=186817 RepID=UPI0020D01786|nr:ATP-grasp domain-containing protein [Alkalihalobacillus sp. LMS6]UTR07055.1 ATP-grasp domain-containing protein [Alkalihalobacillus sp. LMS6]
MGNIVLVGTGTHHTKGFLFKTIIHSGYSITLLDHGRAPYNALADYHIFANPKNELLGDSVLDQLEKIHEQDPIIAVLPLAEFSVTLAAQINQHFLLGGLPPSMARLSRDKYAFREALQEKQLRTVAFAAVEQRADAYEFATKHGFPIMIKPRTLSGSVGVFRCNGTEDLEKAFDYLMDHNLEQDCIVEQFVEGPEYSVESVMSNGTFVFASVTDKYKLGQGSFAEVAHISPSAMEREQTLNTIRFVERALKRIGLKNGISHTEIIINENGDPFIVETAFRAGGDQIPDLVYHSYGINLYRLWISSITQRTVEHPLVTKAKASSMMYFFYPQTHAFNGIERIEELRTVETPITLLDYEQYEPQEHLNETPTNNDRAGHVMCTSKNEHAFQQFFSRLQTM